MFSNRRDLKSLLYLILVPILVVDLWQQESFNLILYCLLIVLQIGICCINHNHGHLPIWKNKRLNQITGYWICLIQGCPIFLMEAAHINSHHRYNQGELDVTRVSKFGNHNNIGGYLLFPFRVIFSLSDLRKVYLKKIKDESFVKYFFMIAQTYLIASLWCLVLYLNWKKALVYVIFPQLMGIHFLLASNYLQHADTVVGSEFNHSRNFVGLMNFIFFNVGYHTAHHLNDNLHWTELPDAHMKIKTHIDNRLNVKSFVCYYFYDLTLFPLLKNIKKRKS